LEDFNQFAPRRFPSYIPSDKGFLPFGRAAVVCTNETPQPALVVWAAKFAHTKGPRTRGPAAPRRGLCDIAVAAAAESGRRVCPSSSPPRTSPSPPGMRCSRCVWHITVVAAPQRGRRRRDEVAPPRRSDGVGPRKSWDAWFGAARPPTPSDDHGGHIYYRRRRRRRCAAEGEGGGRRKEGGEGEEGRKEERERERERERGRRGRVKS
jgi:hypothetical protein